MIKKKYRDITPGDELTARKDCKISGRKFARGDIIPWRRMALSWRRVYLLSKTGFINKIPLENDEKKIKAEELEIEEEKVVESEIEKEDEIENEISEEIEKETEIIESIEPEKEDRIVKPKPKKRGRPRKNKRKY